MTIFSTVNINSFHDILPNPENRIRPSSEKRDALGIPQPEITYSIDDYVKKYNELLAASKYFKKGTFNYYNAAMVARQLKENGFFEAKHTVSLNGEYRVEITSEEQLEELTAIEFMVDDVLWKPLNAQVNRHRLRYLLELGHRTFGPA